ncbi:hypothetical protein HDU81_008138 [Chytriomyces hyalinus]|nr:hypothetical protein HDU81_008138 [Chytriomyces hyalinus]
MSQPMMNPLPPQFFMAPPNVNQQSHTREQFMPYTMPQMLSTPPLTPIPSPIVVPPARPAAATPHVIYKQQPVGYAHPSQLGYQIPGNPNSSSVVQPQFYTPQSTGVVGAQAFPPQVLASQSNSAFGMYSYPQQGANTRPKTLISFSRNEVETSKTLKDAAYASRALKDRAKHDEILRAREQNL